MAMNRREKEKSEARKTNAADWAKRQERSTGSSAVKLPDGVESYKLDPGKHQIDILLYRVGKGNPEADEGFLHFERTFESHGINTPDGFRSYCCAWKCFKKKCAVCDFLQRNGSTADPQLVRSLRAKIRHLWLVNDKPGDAKNPLKVLDTNHYNKGIGFGELLVDGISSVPKYARFADLDRGLTLQITVKEQKGGGFKYHAATRIDFLPRDYEYPKSVVDKAPCLDDCLVLPDYKELARLLNQGGPDGEEEEDQPSSRRRAVDEEDELDQDEDTEDDEKTESSAEDLGLEEGDLVMYKKNEYEITKISGDGTSLTLTPEKGKGKVLKGIDPEEVKKLEDVEEPEDEEKPRRKPTKGKAQQTDEDEEDETEEEDEDSDEDSDEEEDDQDDLDEDEDTKDEEEEEESAARKRKGRR